LVIKKDDYKKSIFFSLLILAIGMVLFVPTANMAIFPIFLLALFIGEIGKQIPVSNSKRMLFLHAYAPASFVLE